jgi:hypothetical protein
MTDRTDSIHLAHDEPRCEPSACTMQARCARKLASLPRPPRRATMNGVESWISGGTALCTGYVDAAGLRKLAEKPGHYRVHPPLGSA